MITFDVEGAIAAAAASITPKAGEVWHVKFPGAIAVTTVIVRELTQSTIAICEYTGLASSRDQRYEHGVVNFIEKVR